jgi:predicted metal-binding membrane protein
MGLLFVAGVMNLPWVAALAILVLLEELVPWSEMFAKVTGVALSATGIYFLMQPV